MDITVAWCLKNFKIDKYKCKIQTELHNKLYHVFFIDSHRKTSLLYKLTIDILQIIPQSWKKQFFYENMCNIYQRFPNIIHKNLNYCKKKIKKIFLVLYGHILVSQTRKVGIKVVGVVPESIQYVIDILHVVFLIGHAQYEYVKSILHML